MPDRSDYTPVDIRARFSIALAASATKSDGGAPAICTCEQCVDAADGPSDPLSAPEAVTAESALPLGCGPTDPQLLALVERARNHIMTPEEMYEQRRSFVRGMCPSNRDYKQWCEEVDRHLPPPSSPAST
jgi:hypothetical protein